MPIVGNLLRGGVMLAAAAVLAGGVFYLMRQLRQEQRGLVRKLRALARRPPETPPRDVP